MSSPQSPEPEPERDERSPASDLPEPRASELIGQALGDAARRAGIDPAADATTGDVVWKAMGGWRGVFEAVLPGLVFIVAYTLTMAPTGPDGEREGNLWLSLGLSVGIAALFTILRLVQRSTVTAALGGLVATAAAAALALFTGRGEDNFIPGFITNALYGTAFLVSALIGWSIIGLIAGFLMNEGTGWRSDPRKRRVFFWLALAWAALFYLRLGVQFPLYLSGDVAALGTLKLLMGLPLFAPLIAVTWLAARAVYRRTAA